MSRSTLYAAIKSGSCPLVVTRIGKQLRIPKAVLNRLGGDAGPEGQSFLREPCPTCGWPSSSSRPTNSAAFWSSSVTVMALTEIHQSRSLKFTS